MEPSPTVTKRAAVAGRPPMDLLYALLVPEKTVTPCHLARCVSTLRKSPSEGRGHGQRDIPCSGGGCRYVQRDESIPGFLASDFERTRQADRLVRPVVLFVDDDDLLLASFRRQLRETPFDVFTATSAEEAQRILASTPVQVIVSDERMPGGSGTELLRAVRERYPSVVRIALTGEADIDRATRLIDQGEVYRFLTKPIERSELLRTLERALAMKQIADEGDRVRQSISRKSPPT